MVEALLSAYTHTRKNSRLPSGSHASPGSRREAWRTMMVLHMKGTAMDRTQASAYCCGWKAYRQQAR